MSYILDALRKADAQRERDAARGIHAQNAAFGGRSAARNGPSRTAMAIALVTLLVFIAAGVWYFKRSPQAPAPDEPAQAAVRSPARVGAPPQAAVAPAAQQAENDAEPEEPAQRPPAATIVPPPAPPNPMSAVATQMVPQPSYEGLPNTAPNAPPVAQRQPPPAAPPTPAVTGLPADAPRLAISGGVYSPNPAQRMLIVNGQVFNEGSEVAPGVKLEKVEARTAILGFRGARYTVAY